ncbi:hypothetical protein AAMO2058_001689100 [Amorphochlora amoebiformis]
MRESCQGAPGAGDTCPWGRAQDIFRKKFPRKRNTGGKSERLLHARTPTPKWVFDTCSLQRAKSRLS